MKLLKRFTDSDIFGISGFCDRKPHQRVSAVLLDDDGLVATICVGIFNFYTLPGGGVEDGETEEQAVLREILEETGCHCEIIDCLGVVEENSLLHDWYSVSTCFLAKVVGEKGEPSLEQYEIDSETRVEWHGLGEVLNTIINQRENKTYSHKDERNNTVLKLVMERDIALLNLIIEDENKALNEQKAHWEQVYADNCNKFGTNPSWSAVKAAEFFKANGVKSILELGGGQGRDAIFFAEQGFNVHVLDYSDKGLDAIQERSQSLGLSHLITTTKHDARQKLPFNDSIFDACYSHMFFCMAFTMNQLENINKEILRVLKPQGINIFTTRNTSDAHFGTGTYHREGLYEVGGFIVHFLGTQQINQLSKDFQALEIIKFEEGELPKKLFYVALQK
ncbi:MAG: methyltransferase domain-containing protein [Defluviitaleaceae bacterium]|nr:methyltransferase domain-containing protein [Defluviitaleaceae bacterium]